MLCFTIFISLVQSLSFAPYSNCLVWSLPFAFSQTFQNELVNFSPKTFRIFLQDLRLTGSSVDQFGKNFPFSIIFTLLNIPNHKYGIFICSLGIFVSFNNIYGFLERCLLLLLSNLFLSFDVLKLTFIVDFTISFLIFLLLS